MVEYLYIFLVMKKPNTVNLQNVTFNTHDSVLKYQTHHATNRVNSNTAVSKKSKFFRRGRGFGSANFEFNKRSEERITWVDS